MALYFIHILIAVVQFVGTDANAVFLGSRGQHVSGGTHLHAGATSNLLQQLEMVAGRDQRIATEYRVERLENALRPMFQAVPKCAAGKIGFDTTRFLLHRLFVQRHGWSVNGLDPAGEAWNSSSPTDIFKQHSGGKLQNLFEKKLGSDGFDLHHVAVLAATFESLVHAENIERLRGAYRVLGHMESDTHLTDTQVDKVVRAFMIMYVLGLDHDILSKEEFEENSNTILDQYPTWPDTEVFVNEVRQSVLAEVVGAARTTWESTLKVLEQIGERYGRWQDKECRALKKQLRGMEVSGTGRVPLEKFYSGGVDDQSWMYLESVPYLQELGALDQSNPEHLSVIIPNYLNSPSNCVASSKFYSVCCMDECDALLSTLEMRIGAWEASPEIITQIVSGMASDTNMAPQRLSDPLLQRLQDIAKHHNGNVPLHSRLFAQWMHHVYPRECPYPHVSGTTAPAVPEEYEKRSGKVAIAGKDEIKMVLDKSKERATPAELQLPWSDHEELFIARPTGSGSTRETANGLIFAVLAGIVCTTISVHRALYLGANQKKSEWVKDHFV